MFKRIVMMALVCGCSGVARAAQTSASHRFLPLTAGTGFRTTLWDSADVTPSGDEVQTSALSFVTVYRFSNSGLTKKALAARLAHLSVSCRWRTYRVLSFEHGIDPEELDEDPTEQVGAQALPRPGSPEEEIVGRICDPPGVTPGGVYSTVADARAYAAARMGFVQSGFAPAPPPLVVPPPPPAPPPPPVAVSAETPPRFPKVAADPLKLTLVAEDKATGNMAFLDWAHVKRSGDQVIAPVLYILGPGVAAKAPSLRIVSVVIASARFDCAGSKIRILRSFAMNIGAGFEGQSLNEGPFRPAAQGTVDAIVLDKACHGRPSGHACEDLDGAVGYAQTRWAKRPGG